ncbi:hypothetical protein [Acinetobacter sp. ANC 4648]|uniref:hypothetical protein n=1 Tax=Acinetobacter sp. ANC 4648 TaxID=1977875 RepID=UPI000A330FBA|nr:hypothetical protein [Acinetobacter sp. ANC 4648]OTG79599.1 hypothetical protein B9T27_14340 [Acinetobacter sp. ANC 4648]
MDRQLEQTRDSWVNAFFTGNYDVLAAHEDQSFKVINEKEGISESSLMRYEKIAHAVKNGVWKPQKPNVLSEEFEFDHDLTECKITISLENEATIIQELWVFKEDWKIVELRFCKVNQRVKID